MIKYLLCLLFGHKFVHKIISGKTITHFFGDAYNTNTYRWEKSEFCMRCGKMNPYYGGK